MDNRIYYRIPKAPLLHGRNDGYHDIRHGNGLGMGSLIAVRMPGELFQATALGMLVGGIIGSVAGLPISIMAVLDGLLSGIMGGMMVLSTYQQHLRIRLGLGCMLSMVQKSPPFRTRILSLDLLLRQPSFLSLQMF
jgi:hypothetical protein